MSALDYTELKPLQRSRRFQGIMDRAITLKKEIDAREIEYNALREALEPVLAEAGVVGQMVVYKGYVTGIVQRKEGTKLNRKKLVVALQSRGYDLAVIEEGSDITEASQHVQIREHSEPKTEEEADKRYRRG